MNNYNEREDCTFHIPSLDMYGRENGDFGLCSNAIKFIDKKREFSIYDHIVCWSLNPKLSIGNCSGCNFYDHNNIIRRKLYLMNRVLKATGLSNPFTWGWFLKQLLFPRKKCECETKQGEEN